MASKEGRKIVLAVDESAVSQDAVKWASAKLLQPGDEVHLVSVLEPATRPDFLAAGEAAWPLGDTGECKPDPAQLERAGQMLKRCRDEAQKTAGVKDCKMTTLVSCVGGSADTARHLCEYAADKNAEMVVLGSRGMGSATRAMMGLFGLGSVSDFVVKHAAVPSVVVHRAEKPVAQQKQ